MPLPHTDGTCPHCGKEITGYMKEQSDYGSPIITCKKCGGRYIDARYHEIAVEGIGQNALSGKRDAKIALIGFALFAVSGLVNLFTITTSERYSVTLAIVTAASVIIMLCALVDFIRIKSGAKQKHLDKLREKSEARLSNPQYARELADAGYTIPEQYLK